MSAKHQCFCHWLLATLAGVPPSGACSQLTNLPELCPLQPSSRKSSTSGNVASWPRHRCNDPADTHLQWLPPACHINAAPTRPRPHIIKLPVQHSHGEGLRLTAQAPPVAQGSLHAQRLARPAVRCRPQQQSKALRAVGYRQRATTDALIGCGAVQELVVPVQQWTCS